MARARRKGSPSKRPPSGRRVVVPLEEALLVLERARLSLSAPELRAFRRTFPRSFRHYYNHFSGTRLHSADRRDYAMVEALETVYISDIPRLLGMSAREIHRRFRRFHERVIH